MRILLSTFILLVLAILPVSAGAEPLAVSVSIPPQKYFVEKVGGSAVAVTVMAAKGQDPHTYEPTAAQMEGITKADLYFTINVPFEKQWIPKFVSLNPSLNIVSLADVVDSIQDKPDLALRDTLPGKGLHRHKHHAHGHEHGHGHEGHHHEAEMDDPHLWLSPADMMRTVPVIVDALGKSRPELAKEFAERGQTLLREIEDLNGKILVLLAPVTNRTFLTFHQSWAYYVRNFNLREASVELEGRSPGPKSMAMLIDFARANAIRVIVADSMTAASAVKAIAQQLGTETVHANPLAEDWPDALLEFSIALAKALGAR